MQEYQVKVYDNRTEWYQNGKLHRTDGPAIEFSDGTKVWYKEGQLHRTDGPAIEWTSGTKKWCKEGQLHRTDGPAIEWTSGGKEWWLNGLRLSQEEFLNQTTVTELTLEQIAERFNIPVSQLKIKK